MFHVSRETFFCFTGNCFSVKQKTLHENEHCGVEGRYCKRPPQARECAKVHSLFKFMQKTKVKTEKIIEKITSISTWIYWK